jgi:hypothetical protein
MNRIVSIARLSNRSEVFTRIAANVGFASVGDVDRFIYNVYGKALRDIPAADRPRGAIFILEPPRVQDRLGTSGAIAPLLRKIQADTAQTFYALKLDLDGGLGAFYQCTPDDRRSMVGNQWTQQVAQQFSSANAKVIVFVTGVSASVYISGELYLESPDVIEELPAGVPGNFENLSWDDGGIIFVFADADLNDRSAAGIWQLPDNHLLRPRPELLMSARFGRFLQFRLAGYAHHEQEAHVENEGRVDVSLQMIDGRVVIIEIKWVGCCLVAARAGQPEKAIKDAIKKGANGWLTEFDDAIIDIGVRQLVRYYKTGKYRRAYLAIIDCTPSGKNGIISVPTAHLEGHSEDSFRLLRACVDPRPASVRARTPRK